MLPTDIGEIRNGRRGCFSEKFIRVRPKRRNGMVATKKVDRLSEARDGEDVEALNQAGLPSVFFREDDGALSALARLECDGEGAFYGAHGSIKREFPCDAIILKVFRG
jgi:hypothetical protein